MSVSDRAKQLAKELRDIEWYSRKAVTSTPAVKLIQAALDAHEEEIGKEQEQIEQRLANMVAEAEGRAAWHKLLLILRRRVRWPYVIWSQPKACITICGEKHEKLPCEFDADGLPVETPELRAKLEELL